MSMEGDGGRYHKALHAMQTGVAMEMFIDNRKSATDPKHLRVGVNSALVSISALVHLLLEKGLITQEELMKHEVAEMEKEVARYEERLFNHYGREMKLE